MRQRFSGYEVWAGSALMVGRPLAYWFRSVLSPASYFTQKRDKLNKKLKHIKDHLENRKTVCVAHSQIHMKALYMLNSGKKC